MGVWHVGIVNNNTFYATNVPISLSLYGGVPNKRARNPKCWYDASTGRAFEQEYTILFRRTRKLLENSTVFIHVALNAECLLFNRYLNMSLQKKNCDAFRLTQNITIHHQHLVVQSKLFTSSFFSETSITISNIRFLYLNNQKKTKIQ